MLRSERLQESRPSCLSYENGSILLYVFPAVELTRIQDFDIWCTRDLVIHTPVHMITTVSGLSILQQQARVKSSKFQALTSENSHILMAYQNSGWGVYMLQHLGLRQCDLFWNSHGMSVSPFTSEHDYFLDTFWIKKIKKTFFSPRQLSFSRILIKLLLNVLVVKPCFMFVSGVGDAAYGCVSPLPGRKKSQN